MYTDYINHKDSLDYELLKKNMIPGDSRKLVIGKAQKIEDHLANLYVEFAMKSELEFFHSYLIVHIRRNIQPEWCIEQFNNLWHYEHQYLCKQLATRWLVSACDTMIDFPASVNNQLTAITASLFLNTIKLYETENLMLEDKRYTKNAPLPSEHELFDSVTAFAVGKGDMIKNLMTRIVKVEHSNIVAFKILLELLRRTIHELDTVYFRMLKRHIAPQTYWEDIL